jgi:hypothetical protein
MEKQVIQRKVVKKDGKILLRYHFSPNYQAASALVLNGKITLQNLNEEKKHYDSNVIRFAEIILNEEE